MLGTFSKKLAQAPFLQILIGEPVVHLRRSRDLDRRDITTIVGWGYRPSTNMPRRLAKKKGIPFITLEDGFLRSFGTGATHPTLSMVVDHRGIYYAADHPSDLELMLESSTNLLIGRGADYARARNLIIEHGLSKYNSAPDLISLPGDPARPRILVVDQTNGDASISRGMANEDTFVEMLACARQEHPTATIYIKTHPEVIRGDKVGHYADIPSDDQTVLLRDPVNAVSLLKDMDHVYVVTSHLGFEALLVGKRVSCFGMPWYAGWGVTDDRQHCTRRKRARTIDELFAAAYLHYTRYIDPETHQLGSIFNVIDWLIRQQRMHRTNSGRTIAIGFRRWKAANVAPFLGLDPRQTHFVKNAAAAEKMAPTAGDRIVVWGAKPLDKLQELIEASGAQLTRMEDGFIRSVGLGSDFIPAHSLVLDNDGLYFDARQRSGLECILSTRAFSPHDRQRAHVVHRLIIDNALTKYNVEPIEDPEWRQPGRHIVLVPGQVEDDASILYGAGSIKDNLALLKAARKACPDAFIVYKPHPDVAVRNRKGRIPYSETMLFANAIETRISIVNCVAACDELHTMTSLSGFEALLRNKKVVVYGRPFYAGWGLTEDRDAMPQRARSLSLEELIAGALLFYPTYWDWTLKGYTTCEAALRQIVKKRDELILKRGLSSIRRTYFQRQWHKVVLWAKAGFAVSK
ncbi:capsular polysaccharide biosynthesis protein [Achromobacter pestifer]